MTYHFVNDKLVKTDEILLVQLNVWYGDIWAELESNYDNMVTFYKWDKRGNPLASNGCNLSKGESTHTRLELKFRTSGINPKKKISTIRHIKPLSQVDINKNIIHFKDCKSNYGQKIRDGKKYLK